MLTSDAMKQTALVLALVLGASACTTITRGTVEMFAIETDPPGAIATLSNGRVCKTPCTIRLKRKSDFRVEIIKPGYQTFTTVVTSSIDGAGKTGMAGNVLVGGLIGAGVDAGTGAMHSHQPNPLVVVLQAIDETPSETSVTTDESEETETPQ